MLVLLVSVHAHGQGPATPPPDGGTVNGTLAEELDRHLFEAAGEGFSGAVLLAKDGTILLHRGYGLADRERERPVTPETVFDIGSITKQFTAAAILKLEEQGRLRVSDPITTYFENVPADKRGITLHHLLTHSVGLKDVFGRDYDPMARDSLVRLALESELVSAPGARYRYSNTGYSLLGAIIEKASGQGYEQFLHEALFAPAGMHRTGYVIPQWADGELAHGYRDGKDWGTPVEKVWAPDGPYWNLRANGGILSTVGDLYRWHQALEGNAVLSEDSKRKLFTPHVPEDPQGRSHYGYGWAIFPTSRGTRLIAHDGGNGVFFADFRRYVDEGVVLIGATNQAGPQSEHVWKQVVRTARGQEWQPYTRRVAIKLDPAVYDAYVGSYRIAPEFTIAVTREGDRVFAQATGQPRLELLPESESRFFAVQMPDAVVEFVRDEEGRVSAFVLRQGDEAHRGERIR